MDKELESEPLISTTEIIHNCEAYCKTCRQKLPQKALLEASVNSRGGSVTSAQPSRNVIGIIKECKSHHIDKATGFSTSEDGDHNHFILSHRGREIGFANVSSRSHNGSLDANHVDDILKTKNL